jgi:hypothetical protein
MLLPVLLQEGTQALVVPSLADSSYKERASRPGPGCSFLVSTWPRLMEEEGTTRLLAVERSFLFRIWQERWVPLDRAFLGWSAGHHG